MDRGSLQLALDISYKSAPGASDNLDRVSSLAGEPRSGGKARPRLARGYSCIAGSWWAPLLAHCGANFRLERSDRARGADRGPDSPHCVRVGRVWEHRSDAADRPVQVAHV